VFFRPLKRAGDVFGPLPQPRGWGTQFSKPLLDAIQKNGAQVFQQVDGKWANVTKPLFQSAADIIKNKTAWH
jgi:hypothetical protein